MTKVEPVGAGRLDRQGANVLENVGMRGTGVMRWVLASNGVGWSEWVGRVGRGGKVEPFGANV